MKSWILKNPWSILVLIVLSLATLLWFSRSASLPHAYAYYFDLHSGELFVGMPHQIAPIPGPYQAVDVAAEARLGVRAYVFACHRCDDQEDRFVGWVEIDHPRIVERVRAHHPDLPDASVLTMTALMENSVLIRPAEPYAQGIGGTWFADDSKEAQALRVALRTRCDGKQPIRCIP